jgi:hypothetical protein
MLLPAVRDQRKHASALNELPAIPHMQGCTLHCSAVKSVVFKSNLFSVPLNLLRDRGRYEGLGNSLTGFKQATSVSGYGSHPFYPVTAILNTVESTGSSPEQVLGRVVHRLK